MTNSKKYTAFRYTLLSGEIVEKWYSKPHTDNEMYNYFKNWCRKHDEVLTEVVWLEYFNCNSGRWC